MVIWAHKLASKEELTIAEEGKGKTVSFSDLLKQQDEWKKKKSTKSKSNTVIREVEPNGHQGQPE